MRRITNVRLPSFLDHSKGQIFWWVLLDENDVVVSINPLQHGSALSGNDWRGDWLSPMGFDLQINGGLGLSFPDLTEAQLPRLLDLLDLLWHDGVEAICPTFVSCQVNQLRESLSVLRTARTQHKNDRCKLLGAHLEGPFISPSRVGAHSLENLFEPTLDELDARMNGFEDEIAMVTIAPELDGSGELIKRLTDMGIIVSLGHTTATKRICLEAFSEGARMITHAFNAMPGLAHREPGPIGAAIQDDRISIGLIADGIHVHPDIAVFIQRLVSERLVLVSDALSPYGLRDGDYIWDQKKIIAKDGICRREDGTLAGVAIPFLEGCIRMASWSSEPGSAIFCATVSPRNVLSRKGGLEDYLVGKSLKNLLRWKWNSSLKELIWQKAA